MLYCTNCGKSLNENGKFCIHCGTPVKQKIQNTEIPKELATKTPNTPTKKQEGKFTKEGRKIIGGGPKPSQKQKVTSSHNFQPKKKKTRSFLGCLGKGFIGVIALLIVGVFIIWNLPDDDTDIADTLNETENTLNEAEKKLSVSNNFEALNVDLSLSNAVVGDLMKNGIQLDIPDEAFDQNIKLQVKHDKSAPSIDKKRATFFGTPYQISIDQQSKRLNKPITVKLKLSKQDISKLKHSDIWIGSSNGGRWDYFKPQEVNLKDGFVKFETYHFSWFSEAEPSEEEMVKNFAQEKAVEQWSKKSNSKPVEQAVKQILLSYLGIENKGMTQDIVESMMNEGDFNKLLVSFNDKNKKQFNQDLAIFAGKIIVNRVKDLEVAGKEVLKDVTDNASKIGAAVNISVALSEGDYQKAAEELSMEIINSYPITKLFREGAKVIGNEINRWREQGVKNAYEVYKEGVDKYGYDSVEKGNFEQVWEQMKGVSRQLIIEEKKRYAKQENKKWDKLTEKEKIEIEKKVKTALEQQFKNKRKEEDEILKLKKENIKLLEAFDKAKLFEKGRFGYPEESSFEIRMHRLFKMTQKVLKDTKSKIGYVSNIKLNLIDRGDIAGLIRIWYNPDNGKQKYREELIKLGYIKEEIEIDLADGPWEISFYEAKDFFNTLETEEFDAEMKEAVVGAMLEALGKEGANTRDEAKSKEYEASLKKKRITALKKLNTEYDNSLSQGFVNAPKATYEKPEEDQILFLYRYNPIEDNGVYTFTIREGFDLEKGEELRFILDLKSNEYFEAKVFYNSKSFLSIDYMKGKLKK